MHIAEKLGVEGAKKHGLTDRMEFRKKSILSSSKHSPIPEGCRLGAVTFIQRFGKALNPYQTAAQP